MYLNEITDIRQSDNWSKYLALYGWKSIKTRNGSILRINGNFLTCRANLQIPSELSSKDLEEIENICRRSDVHILKISPNHKQDVSFLEDRGYKQTNQIELIPNTVFLDLSLGAENLFSLFTRSCRYSINKANRDGCYTEIVRNPTPAETLDFYKTLSLRAKKKKFTILGLKDVQKKADVFGVDSFICNVFDSKDRLLGTKLFLGHCGGVWGMHSGTTELGQKSTGGYKLLYDCIPYFIPLGYKKMDLGGVSDVRLKNLSKKWEEYSHYKREFNGEVVYYSLPYYKWLF